jgi:hypothetical protein
MTTKTKKTMKKTMKSGIDAGTYTPCLIRHPKPLCRTARPDEIGEWIDITQSCDMLASAHCAAASE